jgi:hypothetical protein
MEYRPGTALDTLAIGETVVDFIPFGKANPSRNAVSFKRHRGRRPTSRSTLPFSAGARR